MPTTGAALWTAVPPLHRGEVHVWIAELDAGDCGPSRTLKDLLDPKEQARAADFHKPRDGARWARSHMLLRVLLGGYLSTEPAGLRFEPDELGKPHLCDQDEALRFNMSHSGATAVYAVALDREVGVDIEASGRDRDVLALAERAFGAEASARLSQLESPQREREFLRRWTRYEASLKCSGTGIGAAARHRPHEYWTCEIDAGEGAVAAVATTSAPARVRQMRWRGTRAFHD